MYALPPQVREASEEHVSGVSCPACCGMLAVHPEGKRLTLVFECRVGHTFLLEELLAAKEDRLEERLWTAFTSLAEFVALLDDVCQHEPSQTAVAQYRQRQGHAQRQMEGLRRLIEDNGPVVLPTGSQGPGRDLP